MDKTKVFEAAGKLASKGQLEKAAKEYLRVLEADPKDVRALQKLAEVYQKTNRPKEATDLLVKVAEGYTEQGFFLKAVAVYKQVLKLETERFDVHLKLAQLYQQLGLVSDATAQYQLVANHHDEAGNVKESLAALRRMVDLDPDNVAGHVRLGELYARERMTAEAVDQLRQAAGYLKKNQRPDDELRVLERIGQLVPDDAQVAKELAEQFLARRDTKRALAKLQVCFRVNPKDVQTLTLLARAFTDLGQEAKTVSVLRELARVFEESGQTADRHRVLRQILELAPGDPEATSGLGLTEPPAAAPLAPAAPVLAPPPVVVAPPPPTPPRPVEPVRPLVAPPPPARAPAPAPAMAPGSAFTPPTPPTAGLVKILTETDVYLKYGLVQKAAEHLAKALAEEPHNLAANEKQLVVLDKLGQRDEAIAQLAKVVELARAGGEADKDSLYTQQLAQRAPTHPLVAAASEAADLEADDELVIEPDELETQAAELAAAALSDDEGIEISTEATSPPRTGVAAPAPWDLESVDDDEAVVVDPTPENSSRQALDLGSGADLEEALDRATGPHAASTVDPFALAEEAQVVEEAASPFDDEEEEWTVVDERMSAARAPAAPEPLPSLPPLPGESGSEGADLFEEELAEIDFLLAQGLVDDARHGVEAILAEAPNHPRAKELLESLGPAAGTPAAAEGPGGFDLGGELADELDGAFDAIAMKGETTPSGPISLASIASEQSLPTQIGAEDSQTHYDLGIAYKEMGQLGEAISELTLALEGGGRAIDCLIMLGLCRREQGELGLAVEAFERALKTPGLTVQSSKAAHYELGVCEERRGHLPAALEHFGRVAKNDPGFRDVAAQVQRLSPLVPRAKAAANGAAREPRQVPAVGRPSMPAPARPRPAEAPAPPAPSGRGKIGFV